MDSHSNESWKSYLDLVSFPIPEILIHFSNLNVIETKPKERRNFVDSVRSVVSVCSELTSF